MHRIVATTIVLTWIFVLSTGCQETGPSAESLAERLVAQFATISSETVTDVEHVVAHAANSERSIMFIHVDWSFMTLGQRMYSRFITEYFQNHPDDNLLFHYVDCTPVTNGYQPLWNLPGWKELMDSGNAGIHGWGELVWMDHGRVIHIQRIDDFDTANDLVEWTEKILPIAKDFSP